MWQPFPQAALLRRPNEEGLKGRFFRRAMEGGELRQLDDAAGKCLHGVNLSEPLAECDPEFQIPVRLRENVGDPLLDGFRSELERHRLEAWKLFGNPALLVA